MVGNASEEGVMTQVKNPSHTAPGRIAVMAGLLGGLVTFIFTKGVLPNFLAILLSLGVCALIGAWLHGRISRANRDREAKQMEEYRATLEAETQRKLREMKAGK